MINSGQYPLIEPLLQDKKSGFDYNWTQVPGIVPVGKPPMAFGEVAGVKWWVAINASVSSGIYIKYKSGSFLTGEWTSKVVSEETPLHAVNGIKFINGHFIIYTGHSMYNANAIFSVFGTPSGTWMKTYIAMDGNGVYDIDYGNGFWCAATANGLGAYCQGASPQGAWIQNYVTGSKIKYANDYWVGIFAFIHYKQGAPNNTWSMTKPGPSAESVGMIDYGNDYWMTLTGFYVQGKPDNLPEGTWPKNAAWPTVNNITFAKDRWIGSELGVGNLKYIIGNPSGSVQTKNFAQVTSIAWVAYENNTWLMSGENKLYFAIDGYRLPDIPVPDAYAYIKVKEL
jgi:hypothetical protein